MDHLKTLNTADLASISGGDNGNLWTFIGKAIGSTARSGLKAPCLRQPLVLPKRLLTNLTAISIRDE